MVKPLTPQQVADKMAKVSKDTQDVIDECLSAIDCEIDQNDPMEKLVWAKMLDTSAKMLLITTTRHHAAVLEKVYQAIMEIRNNQLDKALALMQSAIIIMSSQSDNDETKNDLADIAKKMAGANRGVTVNAGDQTNVSGDNINQGSQTFGDGDAK